jgi:hypothetical protein
MQHPNRQVGFYLMVPGLSTYASLLTYFIYALLKSCIYGPLTEGVIVFLSASAILIIPISLVLMVWGNKYVPLFKNRFFAFFLYLPIPVTVLGCSIYKLFI